MADLNLYRQAMRELLEELHDYDRSGRQNAVESELVFDSERDRYLWVDVGWENKQFIYGTIVHVEIKDDKIWIQRNNTEVNLAARLVEKGIPKQAIVLGFHSPFMRQASGYAVS